MDKTNEETLNQSEEKEESSTQFQKESNPLKQDHSSIKDSDFVSNVEEEPNNEIFNSETDSKVEVIDLEKDLNSKINSFIDPKTAEKINKLKVEMEALDDDIRNIMGKYKVTMWILVACIVIYLLFLFVIRQSWSTYVVLATCVIMIFLAVLNTKYSKQIQQLAAKRKSIRQELEKLTPKEGQVEEEIKEAIEEEAIVANATSLNDLPKQYTVLDEVKLPSGEVVEHIIVSPYGIGVVGETKHQKEIEELLESLNLTAPIFFYDPKTEISQLAENIQMEKQIVLDETQIFTILRAFVGL